MTIAGSDSGGGAGLQADLKTFAAHGVFGTSVVTAVTAQNTAEVRGVYDVDPAFVELQIDTVLSDLPVASVKTGMLASPATVAAVARWAADGRLPNLVVDPVLVASTGRLLLGEGGVISYLELLLPHAARGHPQHSRGRACSPTRPSKMSTAWCAPRGAWPTPAPGPWS